MESISPVPYGTYAVDFNCDSGYWMTRSIDNPDAWNVILTLNDAMDGNADGIIELKFRANSDWGTNWGGDGFPTGVDVTDADVTAGDIVEVFFDGNKSGGAYDASDVHVTVTSNGTVTVVQGPTVITVLWASYTTEVGIPFAALGVTPETGAQAAIDIMVGEVDYRLVWNGGMQDYTETSSFGDLNYGVLSCGCISVHNATIGDVILRNQLAFDNTTTYVGTYQLDNAYEVAFRKDGSSTVSWSANTFLTVTATLGGSMIPATTGRYRITFDCITGQYTFGDALSGDAVAMSTYTPDPPVIDGNLSEYTLAYGSEILASGTGSINNTVTWGTLWDADNLYIAAHVVDAVVEGTGNPWDNDAVEMYVEGDNSKDGTYSAASFDTQLVMDAINLDSLWAKADGVPITDESSVWLATSDGYSIEIRLGWSNLDFAPGKGRTIGWSLGNNDSDLGVGRDYQSVWYGNGNDWSGNTQLGDLELAGDPYFVDGLDEHVLYNANVILYPNPTAGNVNIRTTGDVFNTKAVIFISDITGRSIATTTASFNGYSTVQLNTGELTKGIYFVNILSEDGKRAVKKLIVQ